MSMLEPYDLCIKDQC